MPIQYGGLSVDYCDCNPEFSDADPATELTVKPGTKQTVEITIYEVHFHSFFLLYLHVVLLPPLLTNFNEIYILAAIFLCH